MVPQGQPALSKEQAFRWLASFLSLWLAVAYLWLALFYPLICAPDGFNSYVPVPHLNVFDYAISPFSAGIDLHILRPGDEIRYLRSSESVSTRSWPVDSREDTSGLMMSFIDGISLPGLSWVKPAQPYQTMDLLHTQSYTNLHASPPEQPPRISLI